MADDDYWTVVYTDVHGVTGSKKHAPKSAALQAACTERFRNYGEIHSIEGPNGELYPLENLAEDCRKIPF